MKKGNANPLPPQGESRSDSPFDLKPTLGLNDRISRPTDLPLAHPSENLLVSLGPIHAWLRMRGYSEFDDQGNIIIEKWPVQFLPVNDALSGEALDRAQYLPFDETLNVRVLSPEYLAAESLKVGRPKDLGRISQLTASDEFDSDRFLDLVHRFGLQEKWAKLEPLFDQE
jgi:hypothetical protein